MSSLFDKFLSLTKQLNPQGRAFRISDKSIKRKLEKAVIDLEIQFYNDANAILFSILPDNDNFTSDDATRWEQRLGLITNLSVSLADRKAAIIRKMNHPGNILARQSAGYIQDQLQLAGFDVYVFENLDGLPPDQLIELPPEISEMGDIEMGDIEMGNAQSYFPDLFVLNEMGEFEMGEFEMGETIVYSNIIANYIEEAFDSFFDIGQNYFSTFVICGPILGQFATIDTNRKDEFRQLILKLKPTQTVGILFINYI